MILPRSRRSARGLYRSALLSSVLLLSGALPAGCEDPAPTPTHALPTLPARQETLSDQPPGVERPLRLARLALTGEVRGEIEPCGCPTLPFGGFARRERLLDQLRAEPGGPVFQLDAGELLLEGQSTRARDEERIRLVLDLQRAVGVDVWVPGPTDLGALGLEGLRAEAARADGPRILSATLADPSGALVLAPSAVLERDGVRVGVIGLSAGPTDAALRAQVQTLDPVEAARSALAALPGDLDLVVALGNTPDDVADRVSAQVPGLAAVLTTRGASFQDPRRPTGGLAPVIEAPDRGRYVQVVQARLGSEGGAPLTLEPDAREWRDLAGLARMTGEDPKTVARRAELQARFETLGRGRNLALAEPIPLGANLDGQTRVDSLLRDFRADALADAATEAAKPTTPAARGYASSGNCVNCHTSEFARWAFSDHAKAWESLVMRKETKNPECVGCHTTGYGEPGGLGELTPTNLRRMKGVQCESCHGPLRGHPNDDAVRSRPIAESTCRSCHDAANSPDFDFATYLPRATCQGGAPETPELPEVPASPPAAP